MLAELFLQKGEKLIGIEVKALEEGVLVLGEIEGEMSLLVIRDEEVLEDADLGLHHDLFSPHTRVDASLCHLILFDLLHGSVRDYSAGFFLFHVLHFVSRLVGEEIVGFQSWSLHSLEHWVVDRFLVLTQREHVSDVVSSLLIHLIALAALAN